MTFDFLVDSRLFCKIFFFLKSFYFYGYDSIHSVVKSWITTAYRWLCRNSHSSLSILWSAVVKSPTFFALDTTAAVRLLIFVFRQMSDIIFIRDSEDDSREELADASRCSGTLSSVRFSVNSCNHSGRSRNGSPRTLSLSSFWFGFLISVLRKRCLRCRCSWDWRACR